MLLFVIVFNLILTLFNCYLVWQLWKLTCYLGKVTRQLIKIEQQVHQIFSPAPAVMLQVQAGTSECRDSYQHFIRQLEKLQTVVSLMRLLFKFWQRQKPYNFQKMT